MNTQTEALFFETLRRQEVRCLLCPHYCVMSDMQWGICGVRQNRSGVLLSNVFGKISAVRLDPVEKKPLYHFFPGSKILSFGSFGCNLACIFCQNSSISQIAGSKIKNFETFTPEQAVALCFSEEESIGIAFTYNEPTVWFEFMLKTATLAKEKGLFTAMITNGFINRKPLEQLIPVIDAFNVDLKSFDAEFYRTNTSSVINPVLKNLNYLAENKKHIEITNLVIPDLNDEEMKFEEMTRWIAENTGKETPFHISKYFPNYKLTKPPTSELKLLRLRDIAKKYLDFVYLGNSTSNSGQNTYCSACGSILIERKGYQIWYRNIDNQNLCTHCGHQLKLFG